MAHGTHDFEDDPRNERILIWVNGELVPRDRAVVSVFDSGFVLGDGVWEGLRVRGGHPAFLERHLDRLFEGAKAYIDHSDATLRSVRDLAGTYRGARIGDEGEVRATLKVSKANPWLWDLITESVEDGTDLVGLSIDVSADTRPGTVQGRIRITEQGEVIAAKYGTRDSAAANLQTMTAATLLATLDPPALSSSERVSFEAALAEMSQHAFRAYRELVYETAGFVDFFRQMTPIAEIAELKIGSRPASRTSSNRIEDLRAIPWVFSWAQARVMLPGWYGVGEAMHALGDRQRLREMVEAWPFFRATLANLEMVLAKSDMGIAEHYTTLVTDRGLAERVFSRIRAAWQRTYDELLEATGQARLLEGSPTLDRSIRLRLPYIEPLNLLQVELLRRLRSGERDARVVEGLQLSVSAIATALRNSG